MSRNSIRFKCAECGTSSGRCKYRNNLYCNECIWKVIERERQKLALAEKNMGDLSSHAKICKEIDNMCRKAGWFNALAWRDGILRKEGEHRLYWADSMIDLAYQKGNVCLLVEVKTGADFQQLDRALGQIIRHLYRVSPYFSEEQTLRGAIVFTGGPSLIPRLETQGFVTYRTYHSMVRDMRPPVDVVHISNFHKLLDALEKNLFPKP